ncbi:YbhB/YbcL family Raf kinase inhibitor-like protein [Devosia sp. CAU 1758]
MILRHTAIAALALLAQLVPVLAFEAQFDFFNVPACSGGALRILASPQFRLSEVPEGTTELDFFLTDLTTDFAHRGRAIPYDGDPVVREDAFKYLGPCPFSGTHLYEWRITALDSAGTALGEARVQAEFTASP